MKKSGCKRGEIWLVDFNPGRGSEQQGIRPALIVQNDIGNLYGATTIVASITTQLKSYPITVSFLPQESQLKQPSMANLSQLLTIDKKRLLKKIGELIPDKLKEIDIALIRSLGLTDPN